MRSLREGLRCKYPDAWLEQIVRGALGRPMGITFYVDLRNGSGYGFSWGHRDGALSLDFYPSRQYAEEGLRDYHHNRRKG